MRECRSFTLGIQAATRGGCVVCDACHADRCLSRRQANGHADRPVDLLALPMAGLGRDDPLKGGRAFGLDRYACGGDAPPTANEN
jgi:hypothetical protein